VTRKVSARGLGLVLLAVALVPHLGTAAGELERESFRGVRTVFVMVEKIPEISGLEARLQTAVELRLRKAGVTVLEKDAPIEKLAGVPYLHFQVDVMRGLEEEPSFYAVAIHLGFAQDVFLPAFPIWQSVINATSDRATVRYGKGRFSGHTWTSGSVGITQSVNAQKAILEAVEAQADVFINDYLAVNPPARPLKD